MSFRPSPNIFDKEFLQKDGWKSFARRKTWFNFFFQLFQLASGVLPQQPPRSKKAVFLSLAHVHAGKLQIPPSLPFVASTPFDLVSG
jgi:hypothetical protein